jgi:hypothetical protein
MELDTLAGDGAAQLPPANGTMPARQHAPGQQSGGKRLLVPLGGALPRVHPVGAVGEPLQRVGVPMGWGLRFRGIPLSRGVGHHRHHHQCSTWCWCVGCSRQWLGDRQFYSKRYWLESERLQNKPCDELFTASEAVL